MTGLFIIYDIFLVQTVRVTQVTFCPRFAHVVYRSLASSQNRLVNLHQIMYFASVRGEDKKF